MEGVLTKPDEDSVKEIEVSDPTDAFLQESMAALAGLDSDTVSSETGDEKPAQVVDMSATALMDSCMADLGAPAPAEEPEPAMTKFEENQEKIRKLGRQRIANAAKPLVAKEGEVRLPDRRQATKHASSTVALSSQGALAEQSTEKPKLNLLMYQVAPGDGTQLGAY